MKNPGVLLSVCCYCPRPSWPPPRAQVSPGHPSAGSKSRFLCSLLVLETIQLELLESPGWHGSLGPAGFPFFIESLGPRVAHGDTVNKLIPSFLPPGHLAPLTRVPGSWGQEHKAEPQGLLAALMEWEQVASHLSWDLGLGSLGSS